MRSSKVDGVNDDFWLAVRVSKLCTLVGAACAGREANALVGVYAFAEGSANCVLGDVEVELAEGITALEERGMAGTGGTNDDGGWEIGMVSLRRGDVCIVDAECEMGAVCDRFGGTCSFEADCEGPRCEATIARLFTKRLCSYFAG